MKNTVLRLDVERAVINMKAVRLCLDMVDRCIDRKDYESASQAVVIAKEIFADRLDTLLYLCEPDDD